MKKLIPLVIIALINLNATAQSKFTTKSGMLQFEASTDNFEPVAATNETTSALLTSDGTLKVVSFIEGFQFKKKLMQEHFNQKRFMNSEKFPKAIFSGKIAGFKEGVSGEYSLTGDLTIHGTTKPITTKVTVMYEESIHYVKTNFNVEVADYGINIKSKIAKKIAKTVHIKVDLELK